MFVIFGWGFTTTHVFGAVLPLMCPNCHNEQFWVLKRIRRWFTLFFIPIFPYESTNVLMCPKCAVGREMHGAELKRAKLFAETNAAFEAGSLGEAAYLARLEAIGEASDAQVNKGLAHVTATTIPAAPAGIDPPSAGGAASMPMAAAIPPDPGPRPAPEPPEGLGDNAFCVRCGRGFESLEDSFCPKCGAARPGDGVAG